MLVNEGTYLVNSLGEKWIYSDKFVFKWLDKDGFKHLINKVINEKVEEVEIDGDDTNG